MGKNLETEVGNQELHFGHVKFEMLIRYPNEEEAAGYTVLEFKLEAGDIL